MSKQEKNAKADSTRQDQSLHEKVSMPLVTGGKRNLSRAENCLDLLSQNLYTILQYGKN
jgi:hypothetical protein